MHKGLGGLLVLQLSACSASCGTEVQEPPDFVAAGLSVYTGGLPVDPGGFSTLVDTYNHFVQETLPDTFPAAYIDALVSVAPSIYFISVPYACLPDGTLCAGSYTRFSIMVVYDPCLADTSLVHELIHYYQHLGEGDSDGDHTDPNWYNSGCGGRPDCIAETIEQKTRIFARPLICD